MNRFQNTIRNIKKSREMGERYMIFEELLREEKQEGRLEARQETLLDFLGELGDIPAELHDRIEKLEDAEPYFISEN